MFNINFNYKYFVGGTMFWINYKCFQNFLNNYEKINNYIIKKFSFENLFIKDQEKIGFEYLYERIFSGYITNDFNNYAINEDNEFFLINNEFLKNNKSKFSKKIFNHNNLEIRNLN